MFSGSGEERYLGTWCIHTLCEFTPRNSKWFFPLLLFLAHQPATREQTQVFKHVYLIDCKQPFDFWSIYLFFKHLRIKFPGPSAILPTTSLPGPTTFSFCFGLPFLGPFGWRGQMEPLIIDLLKCQIRTQLSRFKTYIKYPWLSLQ